MRSAAPRVLHIHGSFAADAPLARRCARVIEGLGRRSMHSIASGSGDFSAAETVGKGVKLQRLTAFPSLQGLPLPGRLQRIAKALQDYDLVLSYGRGAVDAAVAHTMFSKVHVLPPLIHHEDGSDETPRQRRSFRSKWSRRVGLGKAAGLVVPNEKMEHAALIDWQQPLGRVKTIRDGVDLKRYRRPAKPDAIARLLKRPGESWVVCPAGRGEESGAIEVVRALEQLGPDWHLVVLGGAAEDARLASEVARLGLDHRVHAAPKSSDSAAALALSDIVALPRGAEPVPLAAIEAMAAARPVVAFDAGEIAAVVSVDNAQLLSAGPAAAMERLGSDRYLRESIGAANRERAGAERDEGAMIAAYRRLYSSAIGREAI